VVTTPLDRALNGTGFPAAIAGALSVSAARSAIRMLNQYNRCFMVCSFLLSV